MKVLSVRQPFAHMLCCGLKSLENRDWSTSYRGPLLIHAGMKFEDEAIDWILDRLDEDERKLFPMHKSDFQRGGIVGVVRMVDCVVSSESKWFCGEYGFVFDRAIPLSFIPMRGQLKIFDAPSQVVNQVKAEFERRKVTSNEMG